MIMYLIQETLAPSNDDSVMVPLVDEIERLKVENRALLHTLMKKEEEFSSLK